MSIFSFLHLSNLNQTYIENILNNMNSCVAFEKCNIDAADAQVTEI